MFLDHTQRRSTVGRTPLDEWSARRRDLYLTTHDTHNRQISMLPVGFETKISAGERPQFFLQFSQTGSTTLHRCVCIYLEIDIFLYYKKLEYKLTNWDSPRLFCNFPFLRFSQSWLFPLYYSLSLITRTFVKPVYWFHLAYNILWFVEYFINGLSVIWNSNRNWATFKIVSWVVPTIYSSAFDCQCMWKVLHPFLWYWCFRNCVPDVKYFH